MAYIKKASFSGGELDPALHERTNLEKFQSGLATARNVIVSKTGRVIDRPGTEFIHEAKLDNEDIRIFTPKDVDYYFEFGHLYMRLYKNGSYVEQSTPYSRTDLKDLKIKQVNNYFYTDAITQLIIHVKGNAQLDYITYQSDPIGFDPAQVFNINDAPNNTLGSITVTPAGSPAGYSVQYAVSIVSKNEQEFYHKELSTTYLLPISAGQKNTVKISLSELNQIFSDPYIMKVFRRPSNSGAYGYIGETNFYTPFVGPVTLGFFTFEDLGQDADYNYQPITPALKQIEFAEDSLPLTVCQDRLIIGCVGTSNTIITSRPKFKLNFTKDVGITNDSAFVLKAGSEGKNQILHLSDNGALIAFTTGGIFANDDAPFTTSNIAMRKKADFVANKDVEPIFLPGAFLFVDATSNSIRNLAYTYEGQNYQGDEITIYSSHLFYNKKITSWAFQGDVTPLLWVSFDDGSFATLTYMKEQQMMAWTRHDTIDGLVKQFFTLRLDTGKYETYAVVQRGTKRYIERFSDRYNSDYRTLALCDSHKVFSNELTGGTYSFTLLTDWESNITLLASASAFSTVAVNDVLRVFLKNGTFVDLEVKVKTSNTELTVYPLIPIPVEIQSGGFKLYKTFTTLTGLSHLNGKSVSLLCDGGVEASPNNDKENYPIYTVSGGNLTIPRAAFAIVGLPITTDVETLNVDDKNGTLVLEDKIVNKVYVNVYNSKGHYYGQTFPENDKVNGMFEGQTRLESDLVNRAYKNKTVREEVSIQGDWNSNGKICIRKVDPLPLEILSIIPDIGT